MLRSVPAAAGTLLVAAHVLARPLLGTAGAWLAALFAAISPAMVLLQPVLHPRGRAGRRELRRAPVPVPLRSAPARSRGARSGRLRRFDAGDQGDGADRTRLHAAGASERRGASRSAGHSRERWPATPSSPSSRRSRSQGSSSRLLVHHPSGIADAARAYGHYLERAPRASRHVHPWHFYLGLLARFPASRHSLLDRSGDPRLRRLGRGVGVGGSKARRARTPGSCASSPSTARSCSRRTRRSRTRRPGACSASCTA